MSAVGNFMDLFFPEVGQRRRQRLLDNRNEQINTLLGHAPTAEAFVPDTFPGEDPAMLSGQPTQNMATVHPGKGLLGGKMAPDEFYGRLLTVPGMEEIAGRGLLGAQDIQARTALATMKQDRTNQFDYADKLRDEFSKEAGEFKKVSDAYGRVIASVDKPSAAGDMALIFNYMKMLDPGSTVREGEYATAQNATGVPGWVSNMYNRLVKGERLNPDQRQDFYGRSQKLYGSQLAGLEQLEGVYSGLSQRFGVDPQNVIVDYRVKRPTPDMTDITKVDITKPQQSLSQPEMTRLEELRKRQGK